MQVDTILPLLPINKELNLRFVLGYTDNALEATCGHSSGDRLEVEPLMIGGRPGGVAEAFRTPASPSITAGSW